WAAGQVLARSFEPDSLSEALALKTRTAFTALSRAGKLPVVPRPWVVCALRQGTPADDAARDTLDAAWRSGRMAGYTRLHGAALERFSGLRSGNVDFALCDEQALGVDPRALIAALARLAADTPGIVPHFGATVTAIEGNEIRV